MSFTANVYLCIPAGHVLIRDAYVSPVNRPSTPEPSSPPPPDGNNDVSPPHPGFGSAPDLSSGDAADSDSEWVYDVYYRDVETVTTFSGGNDAVDMGGFAGFERIAAL